MSALARCATCDRQVEVPSGVADEPACCPLCGGPFRVVAKLAQAVPATAASSEPDGPAAAPPSPEAIPVRLVSRAPIVARLATAPQAAEPPEPIAEPPEPPAPPEPFAPSVGPANAEPPKAPAGLVADPLGPEARADDGFPVPPEDEPEAARDDFAVSPDILQEPSQEPADAEAQPTLQSRPPEATIDDLVLSADVLVARPEGSEQAMLEAIAPHEELVAEVEPGEGGSPPDLQPLSVTDFATRQADEPREATDQVAVVATSSDDPSAAGGVETARAAASEELAVVEVVTTSGLLAPGLAEGWTPWGEAGARPRGVEEDSSGGMEEAAGDGDLFGFIGPRRGGLAAGVAPGAAGQASAPRAGDTAVPTLYARFRQRRRQSGVRGLVGVLVSGMLGMVLVYYLFNLLGGPRYDFFRIPLPGVRHTYPHLIKYPWLPRFGIEPAGGSPQGEPLPNDS